MITKLKYETQTGSVLLISLILLGALSILGLSSLRGALTEEKIARNIQDQHLATEAAESALRHGQRFLRSSKQRPLDSAFHQSYVVGGTAPTLNNWSENAYLLTAAELIRPANKFTFDALKDQPLPQFRLEEFFVSDNELDIGHSITAEQKAPRSTSYFRIIARGVGLTGQNEVLLESVVIERTK